MSANGQRRRSSFAEFVHNLRLENRPERGGTIRKTAERGSFVENSSDGERDPDELTLVIPEPIEVGPQAGSLERAAQYSTGRPGSHGSYPRLRPILRSPVTLNSGAQGSLAAAPPTHQNEPTYSRFGAMRAPGCLRSTPLAHTRKLSSKSKIAISGGGIQGFNPETGLFNEITRPESGRGRSAQEGAAASMPGHRERGEETVEARVGRYKPPEVDEYWSSSQDPSSGGSGETIVQAPMSWSKKPPAEKSFLDRRSPPRLGLKSHSRMPQKSTARSQTSSETTKAGSPTSAQEARSMHKSLVHSATSHTPGMQASPVYPGARFNTNNPYRGRPCLSEPGAATKIECVDLKTERAGPFLTEKTITSKGCHSKNEFTVEASVTVHPPIRRNSRESLLDSAGCVFPPTAWNLEEARYMQEKELAKELPTEALPVQESRQSSEKDVGSLNKRRSVDSTTSMTSSVVTLVGSTSASCSQGEQVEKTQSSSTQNDPAACISITTTTGSGLSTTNNRVPLKAAGRKGALGRTLRACSSPEQALSSDKRVNGGKSLFQVLSPPRLPQKSLQRFPVHPQSTPMSASTSIRPPLRSSLLPRSQLLQTRERTERLVKRKLVAEGATKASISTCTFRQTSFPSAQEEAARILWEMSPLKKQLDHQKLLEAATASAEKMKLKALEEAASTAPKTEDDCGESEASNHCKDGTQMKAEVQPGPDEKAKEDESSTEGEVGEAGAQLSLCSGTQLVVLTFGMAGLVMVWTMVKKYWAIAGPAFKAQSLTRRRLADGCPTGFDILSVVLAAHSVFVAVLACVWTARGALFGVYMLRLVGGMVCVLFGF